MIAFQFFSQPWNSLVSSYVTWFIKCVQKAADGQKQVEKVGIEESRSSLRPCNEIFPTWPNWSWKVSSMTPMGSLQSNVSRITITFSHIRHNYSYKLVSNAEMNWFEGLSLKCSTSLVLGCWLLAYESRDLSQAESKIIVVAFWAN